MEAEHPSDSPIEPFVLHLNEGRTPLSRLRQVWLRPTRVELSETLIDRLRQSVAIIEDIVTRGDTVYGVNTGFGLLAQTRISEGELAALQRNLVLSHSVGTGEPLDDRVARLVMVLKLISLSRGYSGIRPRVVVALQRLLEREIYPLIPSKGSVGASGDLAPLAHMSALLLGEGGARHRGREISAEKALDMAGLEPLELGPKEGLALLNGTQVSTALALAGLFQAEHLMAAALTAGCLCVDAAHGSDAPFDARIHDARGQLGQKQVATVYRHLLADSGIRASHLECSKVQDPYSLRCQPQVMGACLDHMRFAAGVLETEANAVTDNPLVFTHEGDVLSGGNFHAEPVAMASDVLAIAIAEIGALSERRIALLLDTHLSGLPPFLVRNSGVNSGFMIAQVTAAATASENKTLAHPASVDSLPTSANQEDHVSMATFAARRLTDMADNSAVVVAVELLAAVQGIDLRHHETSPRLREARDRVRRDVPFYEEDRFFAPDLEATRRLVHSGWFYDSLHRFPWGREVLFSADGDGSSTE